MVERYRIVIDVRTVKSFAYQIFNENEGIIYNYTKKGRVALYRVYQVKLERDVVEKAELIEARTVG